MQSPGSAGEFRKTGHLVVRPAGRDLPATHRSTIPFTEHCKLFLTTYLAGLHKYLQDLLLNFNKRHLVELFLHFWHCCPPLL